MKAKKISVKVNMKQMKKMRCNEEKLKRYLLKRGIDTTRKVDLDTPEGKLYVVFKQVVMIKEEDDEKT